MSHRAVRPVALLPWLAALAGVSASAWAQVPPPPAAPAAHAPGQRGLSEAVRRAQRTGQVLSAEQVQYDGRDVNRVKIVDDQGRVRVYWDDPQAQRDGDEDRGGAPARRPRTPRQGTPTHHDDDDGSTL